MSTTYSPSDLIGALRGGQVVRVETPSLTRYFRKAAYEADAFEGLCLRGGAFCWHLELDEHDIRVFFENGSERGDEPTVGTYESLWPSKYGPLNGGGDDP